MSEPAFTNPVASPSGGPNLRGRWVLLIPMVAILVIGILLLLHHNNRSEVDRQWQEAVAEADRLDPEWRQPELELERRNIPNDANAALRVLDAARLIPKMWPKWNSVFPRPPFGDGPDEMGDQRSEFDSRIRIVPPETQVNGQQLKALQDELHIARAALVKARRLGKYYEGRFPIYKYKKKSVLSFNPNFYKVNEVVNLLDFDVVRKAQEGDLDGALASCRAILNAGRAYGAEPAVIPMLIRVSIRTAGASKIERTIAQGQPSESALAAVQLLLAKEEAEPILLYATRGERAANDKLMQEIENGKASLEELKEAILYVHGKKEGEPIVRDLASLNSSTELLKRRTALLRCLTQFVELAKMPVEKQGPSIAALIPELKRHPPWIGFCIGTLDKVVKAYHRSQALLRCAIVMVAVERFRQANKSWPTSLQALVPRYLDKVPTDPFDGAPLKLAKHGEGVVIYSVGQDGVDNGGKVHTISPSVHDPDLGFRLWDVGKRRQAPRLAHRVKND